MSWVTNRLGASLPLLLAIVAGLALAVGQRCAGERSGRAAAELEQRKRELTNARAQARAAAAYRRDGAAERLRRAQF